MENKFTYLCSKPFMKKFYINTLEKEIAKDGKRLSDLERELIGPNELKKVFRWYELEDEIIEVKIEKTEVVLEDKPNISYAEMIIKAISESEEGKLTLSQIYQWIKSNYKYFSKNDQVWQNSVRHNLSLNKAFKKIPKSPNTSGKGGYWTIDPNYLPNKIIKDKKVKISYRNDISYNNNDYNILSVYKPNFFE
ncbi:transcription factor [Tubulinosema ratisbonensis]|uniref:Transcription factor n=1 Tax=Tubulinosema ratisbonensis TaxID=291195 RepID=A0A437APN7_9MICR|nr:transcription factor [Tubulinosema ratisbonensis]